MKQPTRLARALVPLAFAAIVAAAPARAQQQPSPAPMAEMAAQKGSDADEAKAIRAANGKMHSAMMSVALSGDADRDFIASMIPHHQGAIDMATIELQYGKDSEARQLAERIVKAQETEIAEMSAWLAKHPPAAK